MPKKTEENCIRTEREIKGLQCELTLDEQIDTGKELAECNIEIRELEFKLAEEKDKWLNTKKRMESDITKEKTKNERLSGIVQTGTIERDVDCEIEYDYTKGTVTVRRLDTDKVIEDREMDDLEKQMQLEFKDDSEPVEIDLDAVVCAGCEGTKVVNGATCVTCKGEGVPVHPCHVCDGSGTNETTGKDCMRCVGKGYLIVSEEV